MWAMHGQEHHGSETPPGMLQSLWRAGSATDEVEGIQGIASLLSMAQNKSHHAGEFIPLAFSSAEVIGSDQWGKQKLLSSFLTP